MNKIKSVICIALTFALVIGSTNVSALAADRETRINRNVIVDGGEGKLIKTVDFCYEDAMYVSLKGMAAALNGTQRPYEVMITSDKIEIFPGNSYTGEYSTWTQEEAEEVAKASRAKNEINVNGEKKSYYSIIMKDGEDGYDAYMTLVDLAMIIDADFSFFGETIRVNSSNGFHITPETMEESGYLQGVNALLIGDSTTGEIFYEYDGDDIYPIASTTKLMTYYVFMDGVRDGYLSLDDSATITKKAADLSESIDGVILMKEGMNVPIQELMQGMLLASSNECALSLAVYAAEKMGIIVDEDYESVYTSSADAAENAFVRLMNNKASELGMSSAVFYNPHGLPIYPEHVLPAKRQNRMTAEDMFKLVGNLLREYPQITDVTSIKESKLSVLGKEIKNTNGLLYNLDEVKGLKTGTTNKSGACLITAAGIEKDGVVHDLVVVLFGAESGDERTRVSEISVRYGKKAIAESNGVISVPEDTGIPSDPDAVVKKLIKLGIKR